MTRRRLISIAALAVGCATSNPSAIPLCTRELEFRVATPECLANTDAQRMIGELDSIFEDADLPLLIGVLISEAGAVESICAKSFDPASHWNERVRLRARLSDARAVPPGPTCLAGSRLDFNQLGAKLAEIGAIRARCEHESPPRIAVPTIADPLHVWATGGPGSCIAAEQERRGEIWTIDQQGLEHVFQRLPTGSERWDAVRGCFENRAHLSPYAPAGADPEVEHRIIDPDGLTMCLRNHGWEPLF